MSGIKIGNVILENNVFLAPMAGITDKPFRLLCKEQGAGLVYTEMASAKGMHFGSEKSAKIIEIDKREEPAAIQLFGSDPDIIYEIIKNYEEVNAVLFDINMGCPAPKITKNGEGSALMKNLPLAEQLIKSAVKATAKPITVKFRMGWDENSINAIEFAKMAEQAGASAITLHGRTRQQFYSGVANWDIIARAKQTVKIPVIGNGDVFSAQKAKELFEYTKCDAIMVARGARGNPWLFKEINEYLRSGEIVKRPSNSEILSTIKRHYEMLMEIKSERIAINEMRTHVAHYIKGISNASRVRNQLFQERDLGKVFELLDTLLA